jgi:hypothetical protein
METPDRMAEHRFRISRRGRAAGVEEQVMHDGVGDRRSFLKSAMAFGLAAPLGGLAGELAAAAPRIERLGIERLGAMFLVDGWVLTRADVEMLFPHAL